MWKMKFLRLGYGLSNSLKKRGVQSFGPFPYLRRKARGRLERDPLLVRIAGQSLYLHSQPCCWEMIPKSVDPFAIEIFKSAIKSGATVLDIGAHVGVFTMIASAAAGSDGMVYAFEPATENFSLLLRNINTFGKGNIVGVEKAVAEGTGTSPFFVCDASWAMNGLDPHPGARNRRTVSVECTSIDEYLGGKPVDVIKMDIEGHEAYALEGMQQTIAASKSLVLVAELNPTCLSASGVSPQAFIARLKGLGFHVNIVDEESRTLRPITDSIFRQAENDPAWVRNLYCIKRRSTVIN